MARKYLRIFYEGKVDKKLDDDLEKVVGKHGYVRWASGYNFVDDERDLAFDKKG